MKEPALRYWIYGPAGSGKTTLVQLITRTDLLPVVEISYADQLLQSGKDESFSGCIVVVEVGAMSRRDRERINLLKTLADRDDLDTLLVVSLVPPPEAPLADRFYVVSLKRAQCRPTAGSQS